MAELMQQSGSQLGLRVYHLCCKLHTGQVPVQHRTYSSAVQKEY